MPKFLKRSSFTHNYIQLDYNKAFDVCYVYSAIQTLKQDSQQKFKLCLGLVFKMKRGV